MAKATNTTAATDDTATDDVSYKMGTILTDDQQDDSLLDEYAEEIDDDDSEDDNPRIKYIKSKESTEIYEGNPRDTDDFAKFEDYDNDDWPSDLE